MAPRHARRGRLRRRRPDPGRAHASRRDARRPPPARHHGRLVSPAPRRRPDAAASATPADRRSTSSSSPTASRAPSSSAHAGDGSGRLFVVEQAGRIRVIRDGRLLAEPYLDIRDRISAGGERGLLGLAFRPTFATDGRLFVNYTDRDGNTVVSEFRAPDPAADRADPGSERVLLRIDQPYANHNGGALAFGPDGLLWIAHGRRRLRRRPARQRPAPRHPPRQAAAHRPSPGGRRPVRHPGRQPVRRRAGGRRARRDLGLRPAQPVALLVRPGDRRPVDRRRRPGHAGRRSTAAGRRRRAAPNFGWNIDGGDALLRAGRRLRPGRASSLPVAEYGHDAGLLGHRRLRLPRRGRRRAGAARTSTPTTAAGTIWGLDAAAERPAPTGAPRSRALAVASFGEDEAGELYVVDLGGRLYRVVAAAG